MTYERRCVFPDLAWPIGLLVGTISVAALVNRFAPGHKARNRRLVILFVLYCVALVGGQALRACGVREWAHGFGVAAELLQAFTLVNLAGTTLFSVALPAIRVVLPMIASDLLVGFGYMVTTFGVLTHEGVNPTGALATGAVVSAVLALSLQSTLGNVIGGVALQLDGSIQEGDWVQLENGKQGKVRSIRWRHTQIETRDWSTIIVPNAQLLSTSITLLGRREGRTVPQRMWVWFNVDFRFAPSKVIEVVEAAIRAAPIDNVASEPLPNVVCMDFTKEMRESFATYAVRYWLIDLAADDPTNSRVRARIYTALSRAGIPLAVPAQTNFVEIKDQERLDRKLARQHKRQLEALRTVHLFHDLTEDELETLAEGMTEVLYTKGETMTRQGAVAHWLYVITSGTAEVRAHLDPDGAGPLPEAKKTVATINAPDFFGEMGLMTGEARVADVVAITDVECFRLGKATFERVLLKRPEMADELAGILAERRMNFITVREHLDDEARVSRTGLERDRILGGIKRFFGL